MLNLSTRGKLSKKHSKLYGIQSSCWTELIVCALHIFSHWFHIYIWKRHWNGWRTKFTDRAKAIPWFASSVVESLLSLPVICLFCYYSHTWLWELCIVKSCTQNIAMLIQWTHEPLRVTQRCRDALTPVFANHSIDSVLVLTEHRSQVLGFGAMFALFD